MNDLHTWLAQQPHGLHTFRIFQQKLETLGRSEPEQLALCQLLKSMVGSYIDAFDEEPLPVAVADRAHHRLLELLASLNVEADAERRLADLNHVAVCRLW